jgi:hypothetical protein
VTHLNLDHEADDTDEAPEEEELLVPLGVHLEHVAELGALLERMRAVLEACAERCPCPVGCGASVWRMARKGRSSVALYLDADLTPHVQTCAKAQRR